MPARINVLLLTPPPPTPPPPPPPPAPRPLSPPLPPRPHPRSIRNLFLHYQEQGVLIVIPVVGTVYMGLLFLFVAANFFLCSFVDPGIYPRGKESRI